ncbi:MAG: nucleotidyltransferase domain-containing protein [Geminicoccaceae bacterium]
MHPSIASHRPELAALCRRFAVRRLELFGSAARDGGEPRDVDFLVEFAPLPPGQHAPAYFGLLAALEDLLGRPVDLVMTEGVRNRRFLEAIAGERVLLHAA